MSKIFDYCENLDEWPPRHFGGFLWWGFSVRGLVAVASWLAGVDVYGLEVLVCCFLFVFFLMLVWPEKTT